MKGLPEMNLARLIEDPPTGRKRAVILDHFDYSHAVILQNRPVPWDDPMAYSNFVSQGQALLKPDTAILHMDRFYAHQVASNPELREKMGAKTRTGYALRTLLADAVVLDKAWALANTLAQTQHEPVLMQLRSPMQWLLTTHCYSGKDNLLELDADDAETASMYLADWLRNFSQLPLAGIILDDRTAGESQNPVNVGLDVYTPVINVTENYGWSLGLRRDDGLELWNLASQGQVLGAEYWADPLGAASAADFIFSQVPASAIPEEVNKRVEALAHV